MSKMNGEGCWCYKGRLKFCTCWTWQGFPCKIPELWFWPEVFVQQSAQARGCIHSCARKETALSCSLYYTRTKWGCCVKLCLARRIQARRNWLDNKLGNILESTGVFDLGKFMAGHCLYQEMVKEMGPICLQGVWSIGDGGGRFAQNKWLCLQLLRDGSTEKGEENALCGNRSGLQYLPDAACLIARCSLGYALTANTVLLRSKWGKCPIVWGRRGKPY